MKRVGNEIYLRFLEDSDAEPLALLNQRNREFFQPYVTDRPEDFYTVEYQRQFIRLGAAMAEKDEKYSLGVFLNHNHELIGVISLTEVQRGALQSCWLGYYMDKEHNGHGYTTEAVGLSVKYAFVVLGLHRIEAGVVPHNTASIRVLEKAGFHREGLNKKNVLIDGKWRDHLHFALVNPVRPAMTDEAGVLSDLAFRSKAVWGYDEEFMSACRNELTITADYILSSEVFVMEPEDGVLGFYAFYGELPEARLDFLYVDRDVMGRGFGTMLWEHAVARARSLGYESLVLDADPHAKPFYLRMGARQVGEVASGSIAGRVLPLLKYDL